MKKVLIVIVVVILLAFGALFYSTASKTDATFVTSDEWTAVLEEKSKELQQVDLTGFNTEDINGNNVTSDIFSKYKVTMVNLWTTDCSPCVDEMPEIAKLNETKPEDTNVITICIDAAYYDKAVQFAKKLMDDNGGNLVTLVPDKSLMNSICDKITFYPTTVFVDSNGKILGDVYSGGKTETEYRKELENRLKLVESNKE